MPPLHRVLCLFTAPATLVEVEAEAELELVAEDECYQVASHPEALLHLELCR